LLISLEPAISGCIAVLTKVKKTIDEHSMLARGDRVIAAVSGGPDSVALLKILSMIADQYDISLVVAHLNHGLRKEESDREEDFVRMVGQNMGIEFISRKVDIAGLRKQGKSEEELCRELRYDFLKQAASDYRATKIALGHHLHDQAETVLMNFLRGSGSEGLRGMLPVREGMIIRPLLQITRKEILAFLEKERLSFMMDSSNAQDLYLRNRIRHHLMPLLKDAFNHRVEENLARTADIMRLNDDYMEGEIEGLLDRWGVFRHDPEKKMPVPEFLKLHEALQYRLIKTLLAWTSKAGKGVGYRHVKAAVDLAKGRRGSGCLDLPGGVLLRREYDLLIFCQKENFKASGIYVVSAPDSSERQQFFYPVNVPGRVEVKEAGMNITFQIVDKMPLSFLPGEEDRIAYMDYEAMCPPLAIRNINPGDRIQPLGMTGTKKIKSLLIDEKVPRRQRHCLPILVDRQSVLWIAGLRMSQRIGITEKTRLALKVEIV